MLVDAHIHIPACLAHSFSLSPQTIYLSSSSSIEEFRAHDSVRENPHVFFSAGIHPWSLEQLQCEQIELWAKTGAIQAIGECGIDLYTPELAVNVSRQRELFANQLAIAKAYQLPLVIHERKGFDEILQFSSELSQLPGVIFHSWNKSPEHIVALQRKNINAFFSIGSSSLRNAKKTLRNIAAIPLDHLLTETDAPFQPPAGEKLNHPGTLSSIVGALSVIKKSSRSLIEDKIRQNITNLLIKD
ncbi:TatD family hydrolase [bacterium]|nr:TatD family hydrolase [bacterium]